MKVPARRTTTPKPSSFADSARLKGHIHMLNLGSLMPTRQSRFSYRLPLPGHSRNTVGTELWSKCGSVQCPCP